MVIEVYKQLLSIKLKEKLRGKTLDSLYRISTEVQENVKQELMKEIDQQLVELEKFYETIDSFILSDNEALESAGSYLLEEFSTIFASANKKSTQ